jgi:hypothetical protein
VLTTWVLQLLIGFADSANGVEKDFACFRRGLALGLSVWVYYPLQVTPLPPIQISKMEKLGKGCWSSESRTIGKIDKQ